MAARLLQAAVGRARRHRAGGRRRSRLRGGRARPAGPRRRRAGGRSGARAAAPAPLSSITRIAAVNVVEGPLASGHRQRAPYDVIMFGGAVAELPDEIVAQLAEGGRLVAVVRAAGGVGRATLTTQTGGANCATRYLRRRNPAVARFRSRSRPLCFSVQKRSHSLRAVECPEPSKFPRRTERIDAASTVRRRLGRRNLSGFAALAGLICWLAAAPAQAQTLTQALADAYNTNPQLLAQRALLRATDEQVPQALSGWRPTVNFTGQVGRRAKQFRTGNSAAPPRITAFSTFYQNSLNLQVTQPVYTGGRTVAQTRQAVNTVAVDPGADPGGRDLGVPGGRPGLSRRGSRPGPGRGQPQQRRGAAQAARSDAGPVPGRRGDPHRCGAGRIVARASHRHPDRRRRARLRQSHAEYVRAVGHPPGRLLLPRERPTLPATREEALTLAADNNFNVISANFAELAARDNIDVVRGQLLPQISLVGDLNRTLRAFDHA